MKKRYFVGGLFIIFVLTFVIYKFSSSYAMDIGPSIICDNSSLKIGESTNCRISMNTGDNGIYGFDATISVGNGLEIVNTSNDSSWQGGFSGNRVVVYTSNEMKGNVSIGSFTIKSIGSVRSSESVSLTNVKYTDNNFKSISYGNISTNVNVLSNNSNLSSLSIDGVSLSPTFNSNVTNYTASTNSDSINVIASSEEEHASISGTGIIKLNYGSNNISVKVVAEDSSVKTYNIVVNRIDNRSNDNNLKSLSIKGYSINFNKDTLNYNIKVKSNVTSVDINYEVNNKSASVKIDGNYNSLNIGDNTIKIIVKAENESAKTYTIVVNREGDKTTTTTKKVDDTTKKVDEITTSKVEEDEIEKTTTSNVEEFNEEEVSDGVGNTTITYKEDKEDNKKNIIRFIAIFLIVFSSSGLIFKIYKLIKKKND